MVIFVILIVTPNMVEKKGIPRETIWFKLGSAGRQGC